MTGLSMFARLTSLGAVALLVGLASCDSPSSTSYVGGVRPQGDGVLVGFNSVGDACRQFTLPQAGGADIYCGRWSQPAGRVRPASGDGAVAQQASAFASALAPRVTDCGAAQAIQVPGATQAVQMSCVRGRWTHAVIAAQAGGKTYVADGMDAVVPAMQRSIGILAGTAQPVAESEGARRSASRRPDPNDFQGLMLAGDAANRDGKFEEAATYFRQAVQLQDKSARKDNWSLFSALMGLSVQLSNQGKFAESDSTFARAGAPELQFSGTLSSANYDHYRALDRMNRGIARGNSAKELTEAVALLESAEAKYAEQLPTGAAAGSTAILGRFAPTAIVAQLASGTRSLASNPNGVEAILGVIETKRNRAIALRSLKDVDGAIVASADAESFARAQGMTVPRVSAFFYRTSGVMLLAGGQVSPSLEKLTLSVDAFQAGWRNAPTAQLAQAQLRRAEALLRSGDPAATFRSCRDAQQLLTNLRQGVDGDLLAPCLAAYAKQAERHENPQSVLADMFDLAQLARGSTTADLTQRAALRLASDPKIAAELGARDSAGAALNDLRERRTAVTGAVAADLDKQIEQQEAALKQSEVDLQQALPNYHTLVEQAVPASTLFKTLRTGEAFVAVTLSEDDGWVFLLRDNTIRIGNVKGGNKRVGELVDAIRKTIEPIPGAGLPVFDVQSARTLYAATLGGVAAGLEGANELTVAPSGRLLSLPFELLVTDTGAEPASADTAYLVKKLAITHVPSAANLLRLREASVKAGDGSNRRWFGFGASRPVSVAEGVRLYPTDRCGESESGNLITKLPALAGASRELSKVQKVFRASGADELRGNAFTRKAVLARSYQGYSVLHFAAHALLASEVACQDEPAIVPSMMPNDTAPALLTATDILVGMKLNADVVVLSACNTGGASGKEGGEGLSGLARSFFFAGARALMVTHWPVDDESSVFLVENALNGMRNHPTGALAPALRDAQLGMMKIAGYEHPFFWAPLAVIGEGGGRGTPAKVATAASSKADAGL